MTASKAVDWPVSDSGDDTVSSARGSVMFTAAHADPSTHQELSFVSWRTSTVVTGPFAVVTMGTSPERVSPCWNVPATGEVMCRTDLAKPSTAAVGVE